LGDVLYGPLSNNPAPAARNRQPASMALRAVTLIYPDPFQKRAIRIEAPREELCERIGFNVVRPAN